MEMVLYFSYRVKLGICTMYFYMLTYMYSDSTCNVWCAVVCMYC